MAGFLSLIKVIIGNYECKVEECELMKLMKAICLQAFISFSKSILSALFYSAGPTMPVGTIRGYLSAPIPGAILSWGCHKDYSIVPI